MDQETNIKDLKDKVKDFCESRDWDQYHNPKELAIGISTEANELLQLLRFKTEEQMKDMLIDPLMKRNIEDELADVLFFVLRFAQLYQVELSSALEKKIENNNQKYPVALVKGNNKKYSEY